MTRERPRPSYRAGVEWIAQNDESAETDPAIMADVPSVLAVAEAFGVPTKRVVDDVLRARVRWHEEIAKQRRARAAAKSAAELDALLRDQEAAR